MIIDEKEGSDPQRFRLTEHDDGAVVVEEQLTPIDLSTIVKMNEGNTSLSFASMSEDGEDRYDFTVSFSPFRI